MGALNARRGSRGFAVARMRMFEANAGHSDLELTMCPGYKRLVLLVLCIFLASLKSHGAETFEPPTTPVILILLRVTPHGSFALC